MTSVSWTNAAKCPDSKTLPYILILNDFDFKILTKSIPLHQPNLVLMQNSISDENFRIHGQTTATHESHHCLCTADPKLPGRLATIHHCGESIWLHSLSTVSTVPPLLKWDPPKRREDDKQQRNYTTKISNASGTMQICSWVAQEPWEGFLFLISQ